MVLKTLSHHGWRDPNRVRTFDFGRRGQSALPITDEGPERRAVFEGGDMLVLDEIGHAAQWGHMRSLGDGSLLSPVSDPSHSGGIGAVG